MKQWNEHEYATQKKNQAYLSMHLELCEANSFGIYVCIFL